MPFTVAVFAGSSFGSDPCYTEEAAKLGKALAARGWNLVYGGGYRGLMGTVAENAKAGGSYVTGVLPSSMDNKRVRLKEVESKLLVVSGMHERKSMMYNLADAFLALPGGIGTVEELAEIFTWKQLGCHTKNVGLLNVKGYWDPLVRQIRRAWEEGFLSQAAHDALIVEDDIEKLLDRLSAKELPLPAKI